jgi:tRNA pseudouridine55 synthase
VRGSAPFGFINAFKPPGPSSAAFGGWVRHACVAAAVGHWGTLDPTACGVLVLALGKATKLLPLLPHDRKRYIFELVLGSRTETGDWTGAPLEKAPITTGWERTLSHVAASLVGPLTQIPPMHSAVKVDGRPLYQAARAGHEVARSPRTVTIDSLAVVGCDRDRARLAVACSAGTYVRTLCEEIGRRLGIPAHMGALLRVAAGPFELHDSVLPNDIALDAAGCLIDPLTVLTYPHLELDDRAARRFAHGNDIHLRPETDIGAVASPSPTVLVTHNGELIGFAMLIRHDDERRLAPMHVFIGPPERQGSTPGGENG